MQLFKLKISVVALLLFNMGEARAFSCMPPGLVIEADKAFQTEQQVLRHRSISISDRFSNLSDSYFIVVGRFERNSDKPFLHEEQLENIRAMYWPPSEEIKMPYQIEYYYLDAFSFEGYKIDAGKKFAFPTKPINARISISAEYEGVIDLLPKTGVNVIGVLRTVFGGRAYELTTAICPTYYEIDDAQIFDLHACYQDGSCR